MEIAYLNLHQHPLVCRARPAGPGQRLGRESYGVLRPLARTGALLRAGGRRPVHRSAKSSVGKRPPRCKPVWPRTVCAQPWGTARRRSWRLFQRAEYERKLIPSCTHHPIRAQPAPPELRMSPWAASLSPTPTGSTAGVRWFGSGPLPGFRVKVRTCGRPAVLPRCRRHLLFYRRRKMWNRGPTVQPLLRPDERYEESFLISGRQIYTAGRAWSCTPAGEPVGPGVG